jgi:hypothetical protein
MCRFLAKFSGIAVFSVSLLIIIKIKILNGNQTAEEWCIKEDNSNFKRPIISN